jgi:hypothetical protein
MKRLLIAAAIGFASLTAQAADIAISAADTYAKIQKGERNVLFIDVRDPVEICHSGSERGEPSAAFVREHGLANARYVVNGFEGGALKEGPQAGFRLQNGWQNSGLPWSAKMNADKIFRTDRQ